MEITVEKFEELLLKICSKETSSDPDGWTPENPLYGHCAVASVLAQLVFGGTLLRASLEQDPKFSHMRSHYVNKLPDETVIDFTKNQFGNAYPSMEFEKRTRTYVLENKQTHQRYSILAFRYF